MKRISAVFAILFCGTFNAGLVNADNEESQAGRRYLNEVFDESLRTGNIVYSEARNKTMGKKEQLTLRVFEPRGDTAEKRVLFVLTPGGAFVQHGENWMDAFGDRMAKAGYVVAINRYRLSTSIDSAESYTDALCKAVADQQAAIRYFVEDAQGANRYRIDPANIYLGGHSAGAIASLHTAYLDSNDQVDKVMTQAVKNYDVLSEKSKQPKTSFNIRGVVNLSGLVTDLTIFDAGEPALLNIHGDRDDVVPIGSANRGHGAIPIHEQALKAGINSELHVIKGGLHNDTAEPGLCPECVPLTRRFIFETMQKASP